ncbi:DUF4870 domain-containing protein [Candidatus Gracilibacteria bacterium]|nr:DUF4870 domain-containing protein [Candidatus Gracilibacteria bacterium]
MTDENTTPKQEELTVGEKIKQAAQNAIPSDKNTDVSKVIDKKEKTLAVLGYISFLCVLPLALKPNSKYCQFHGKQGLVITLFFLLLSWLGWVFSVIGLFLNFVHIIIVILAIMNASKGRTWKIPFVAQVAEKLEL